MFKSKLCALSGSKHLLTLYGPLFSLVLTSCASQPTTPTRSCTRCWSWQLVRAARASECSDSPIAGTVWVHLYKRSQHCPFQWTCSLHSSAFNSGRLGRESPRLPLNTLSGWEGVTGRRLTWTRDSMMWTPVLLYVYKYLAFVKKKKIQELLKRVRFGLVLFLNAKVSLVLYVWKTRAKALSITV